MTKPPSTILLTRPKAQSEAFAGRLAEAIGNTTPILISPILEILELPLGPLVSDPAFLVLTSSHAAKAIEKTRELHGLPAYCVGAATADAARQAGARPVPAGGTAADLIDLIRRDSPASPGLYLRGRHVSVDVGKALAETGIKIASSVVYDQTAVPLNSDARAALAGTRRIILPVFSARSARLLAEQCADAEAEIAVIAISENVAAEWLVARQIARISDEPSASGMVRAVAECLRG